MTEKPPYRTRSMHDEARSLGLDASITRRDFVGATLVGSGAILLGAAAPAFAQESRRALKQVLEVLG